MSMRASQSIDQIPGEGFGLGDTPPQGMEGIFPQPNAGMQMPGLMDVFGGALAALKFPQLVAQTALGGGSQERFEQTRDAVLDNPMVQAGMPMGLGQMPRGVQEFAVDMGTDPLSLLGFNVFGAAAQGQKAGSAAQKVLQMADSLDTGVQKALWGAVKAPFKAVGKGLEQVPPLPNAKVTEVLPNEEIITRPAENLREMLFNISKESALKTRARQMGDLVNALRTKGHTLENDVLDLAGELGTAPAYDGRSGAGVVQGLGQSLLEAATEQVGTVHEGFARALLDAIAPRMVESRAQTQHARLISQSIADPAQKAAADFAARKDGYERMTRIVMAANDVLDRRVLGESQKLPPMPPAELHIEATQLLQQRFDQYDQLQKGVSGIFADLPDRLDKVGELTFPDFQEQARGLRVDREKIEEFLKEAWQRNTPPSLGTPYPEAVIKKGAERLDHVNTILGQLGLLPGGKQVEGIIGLKEALSGGGKLTESSLAQFDEIIKRWPGGEALVDGKVGDFLTADAYDMVLDKTIRKQASNLGITDPGALRRVFDDGTTLWKTLNLDTLTYFMTNGAGGLLMSQIKGVPAGRILDDLARNAVRMIKNDQPPIPRHTENLLEATGLQLPKAVGATGTGFLSQINDVRAYLGKGQNIVERIGTKPFAAIGAAQGAYSGNADTPVDAGIAERGQNIVVGAAQGAAKGALLPVTTKYLLRRLGGGLEATLRVNAWETGVSKGIAEAAPKMVKYTEDIMIQNGVDPMTAARTAETVGSWEGLLSPARYEQILLTDGLPSEAARKAGKAWENVLEDASQKGVKLSHHINFDYESLNNTEQFLRTWAPFSTWAMKAFPFFAESLATHPGVLATMAQLGRSMESDRKERGLTNRFIGTTHGETVDKIWSALLGHPVEAHYNPARGLVPFSDSARGIAGIREDDNLLEKGIKVGESVGLGLHPVGQLVGRLALGGTAPAEGYDRHAGLVQGLGAMAGVNRGRGIDLNRPFLDAERGARRLRGQDPTDLRESAILRRLDEWALRDTGETITSKTAHVAPYLKAKVDKKGELWDKAAREIARDQGVRATTGFVSQLASPQAILTPEEAKIREARAPQNRKVYDQKLASQLRVIAQKNPEQHMGEDVVARLNVSIAKMAEQAGVPFPKEATAIISQPQNWTAKNLLWISDQIRTEETNQSPLIGGYGASGSPQEQRLSELMSVYSSLPALLTGSPKITQGDPNRIQDLADLAQNYIDLPAMVKQGKGGTTMTDAVLAKHVTERRLQLRQEYPLLDEYLTFLSGDGKGKSQEEFFQTRAARR